MSEHKITVAGGTSVRLPTAGKYCDRDIIVTAEGGTASEDLDEVLTEQEALIDELQDALRGKGSAWYDAFWDVYQKFGNEQNYNYAFANGRFTDENYDPKYDIRCSNGTTTGRYVFYASPITDTKVGIYANGNNAASCFADADVETIRLFHVQESTTFSGTFTGADRLVNLTMGGSVGQNISFSPCVNLSKDSHLSILNALSDTASGKTVTFSTTAVTNAFGGIESEEWLALVGTKPNWTFAYA